VRCKVQEGGLYLFKDFHRKRGVIPAEPKRTYDSYVCRVCSLVLRKSDNRPDHIYVKVLACDVKDIEIGISDVCYNFRICTSDKPKPDGIYHRELIVGDNKNGDCLTWKRFSKDDIPLCISWEYFSDELKGVLDESNTMGKG